MAYPYNQVGEIQKLINLYRARPDLFDSDQVESLHNKALDLGMKFKPLEQTVNIKKLAEQAAGGFIEGFTTIPVAERPRTTYESIARSMGHLAGFAPSILSVPIKLVAKTAGKVGLKTLEKKAQKAIVGTQKFGEWSIPMIGSRFAKGKTASIIDKTKLSAADTFKVGGIGRQITEEAIGLGAASAISNVWSGGDGMIDGFTSGAIFGGAFGGIGNFVRLGNIFKNSSNPESLKRAESALKAGIGSTIQGLPSTLRDEPIEMQLYEYLLGGFFGYNARPASHVEGGKFITGLTTSNRPENFFDPTKSPKWGSLSKKAQDYVTTQSTEQSKSYLQRNFTEPIDNLSDSEIRSTAYNVYNANKPKREISTEVKEDLAKEDSTDFTDPKEILPVALRTKSIAEKAILNFKEVSTNKNVRDFSEDIKSAINQSKSDNVANVETFINNSKIIKYGNKSLYDVLTSDKVINGESNLRRYYHYASLDPKDVYVAVFSKNGVNMQLSKGNEYDGKVVDVLRPEMPINELSDIKNFQLFTHSVKNNKISNVLDQASQKNELNYNLSAKELHAIDMQLLKDPSNPKYRFAGVKDKNQIIIAEFIDSAEGRRIRINDIYNALEKTNREALKKGFEISQKETLKALKGENPTEVKELHERKMVSNILHDANINGLYNINTVPNQNLNALFNRGYGANVVDVNKRMQLYTDSGIPQVKESYSKVERLKDGYFNVSIIDEPTKWFGKDIDAKVSDADGAMYFLPEIIDSAAYSSGFPRSTTKIKPVIAGLTEKGVLLTKSNGQKAFGAMLEYMRKNNIDVLIQDSSAKLKGTIEAQKVKYEGKDLIIDNPEVFQMNLSNLRINPSTYENSTKAIGNQKLPLQAGGVLNTLQTKKGQDAYIDHFIRPSVQGTEKGRRLSEKPEKEVIEALEKDFNLINELPLDYIINGFTERNSPKSVALRKAMQKIRPENADAETVLDTDVTFDAFHSSNKQLFELAEGLYIPNVVFKTLRRPFESQLRKYVLSRYKNPTYKYSGKAWLNGLTPDMYSFFDMLPGKRGIKNNEIVLDDYHKKTPAIYKGKETTLGKLFEMYKKNPNNQDLKSALELMVIRVPADSTSAVRMLNLVGFSKQKGAGAFTPDFANKYMGGADKDSDSVSFYQNIPEPLKNSYARKIGNKENSIYDERSHINKKIQLELDKKTGTDLKESNETKILSRWSPYYRETVHKSAITGKSGLGYGLGSKSIFLEIAHQIKNKHNNSYKENYSYTVGGKKYNVSLDLKVKNNNKEFFDLMSQIVNVSADSSKYPRQAFFGTYRDLLANSLFEGKIVVNGKQVPLKWNYIFNEKGNNNFYKEIAVVNRTKPLKTPSQYPRDEVLEKFSNDLESTKNVDYGNVDGKVAKIMYENGVSKVSEIEPLNFELVLKTAKEYASNKKELELLKNHASDLFPFLLRTTTRKNMDRNFGLDSMGKDLSNISTYELNTDLALKLYRQLEKNNVRKATKLAETLNKIAYKALTIKSSSQDSKNMDMLISSYKNNNILNFANKFKLSSSDLNRYFDYWLLNATLSKSKKDFSAGVWRSEQIPNESKQNMFRSMDNLYKRATKIGEVNLTQAGNVGIGTSFSKELPVLIQSLSKNAINATENAKTIPVVNNIKNNFNLKKKAIFKEDVEIVEKLEKNLEKHNIGSDLKDRMDLFFVEKNMAPKNLKDLNMADIAAFNKYLENANTPDSVFKLTKKFWYLDPRTIDREMKVFDNMTRETMVSGMSGKLKPVKESYSTFGWIRKYFTKVEKEEASYTDKVVSETVKKFPFRSWDIDSQTKIMEIITARKALREGVGNMGTQMESKVLEKNKSFLNKKIRGKTGEEWVQIYDKEMTKFFEDFGNKWLYITKLEKGKAVRVDLPKNQSEYKNLNVNKYIKYDNNGRFNFNNFLKNVITQADFNKKTPVASLEAMLRFQHEYQLDKAYKKGDYIEHRKAWTEKNPFQDIGFKDPINYFPRTNHGKDKGSMEDLQVSLNSIKQEITNNKNLSPEEKAKLLERFDYKYSNLIESSSSKSGKLESQFLDYILDNIGYNNRPQNTLNRGVEYIGGYDRSPEVLDSYQNKIIRSYFKNLTAIYGNYRIDRLLERKPFDKNVSSKRLRELKKAGYNSQTEVFADYIKLYLKDSLGHPSRFSTRIINSMSKGDPLSLNKTLYYFSSDYYIAKQLEKKYQALDKKGWVKSFPFLNNAPKDPKAREEFFIRKIHDLGHLEAKYNLVTLLANTGSMVANVYGGASMTISSGGLKNFVNSKRDSVVVERLLKDQKGNWALKTEKGKTVKTRKDLIEYLTERGVIESYIRNEFDYNPELKKSITARGKDGKDFVNQVTKILKKDINAPRETILQLANRYGLKDAILKGGGWFMQKSERINRVDAFLTHALQRQESFATGKTYLNLSDPAIFEAGLKGIEATQFLYHSASRPAFMRTAAGKVLNRFKLFVFQSVRARKEFAKEASYYGYKEGTEAYEKFKTMYTIDIMGLALASAFAYSLFDTALPPPWDWIQETSDLIFGDKQERERAFWGTLPRPIAPLQVAIPPLGRIPQAMGQLVNGDWERFADYTIHTMYPFGRLYRQIDKTIEDPGRIVENFARLPVNKLIYRYERAKIDEKRKEKIEEVLG